MFTYLTRKKENFTFLYGARALVFILSFSLIFAPSAGYAQSVFVANLPVPGTMVPPSPAFVPVLLKGMTVHPENPLQFDFIVDSGNTDFKEDQIKEESERLVKYFLASMTIPKDDLWVNLSPYESDKIIPEELGKTELGRDMLAQDYILKQLTASLMYPEKELGKEFWAKVYQKAQEKYGTTEIPVDTFNKVWILPETATVYEHGQTVYIVDAKLRVMLDIDYMAQRSDPRSPMLDPRESSSIEHPTSSIKHPESSIETEIIREVILPEIEREVNEGQNFAPLRQIYHSLILAKWYKETIKNSLLSKVYVDQKKTAGVESGDETLKDQIYAQYMEAYKKGVFSYIKEDYNRLNNEVIPRKYFSGGEQLTQIPLTKTNNPVAGNGLEGKGYKATVVNTPQKDSITVATKSSSPILESPYKFDSLADGRDYQIPNLVLGQPNLFTQIGFLGDFIIKVPSKRGMADFKKYVKEETPDPENIRGNEFLEHFNNLNKALERFPEFKTARDQFGDDIAHFLVVHRLQNERLKASGIIGAPETRFVILELPGRFWGKTIVPAVVQKKIEGVSLWDMVDPMSGEFKPLFLSVRDKIKKQLEPLVDSSLSIHVDWNIQNFVWSQVEERLYYVDSKPTTIASKFGVNHNLNSLREVFIEHSQSSSPVMEGTGDRVQGTEDVLQNVLDGLTDVPAGLIGALEEKGQIVSVKTGEIFDIGFGDYWNQIQEFAVEYSHILTITGLVAAGITITGGLYYFWSRYTVSGNINRLQTNDWEARKSAAEALGKLGDTRAIEPLIQMLKDSSSDIRLSAVKALKKIGASKEQLLDGYFEALGSPDSDVRWYTAKAIENLGASKEQMLDGYLEALGSSYSNVRQSAAEALGRLGDVDLLIQMLKDSDSDVRRSAAEAIGRLGDTRAVDSLIQMLKDSASGVRRSATEALVRLGDTRAVDPLIKMLKDSNWNVRWSAAEALGRLGDSQAIEPLIQALKDYNSDVHQSAAEALGRLGDVGPLIQMLKNSNSYVRWSTAKALGELDNTQAVEPLIQMLKDYDSDVRRSAVKALKKLGASKEQMLDGYLKALGSSYSDVRQSAAEALGELGDARAIDPLTQTLKDSNSAVRGSAAEAMGKLGDINPLIQMLKDYVIRRFAAETLGKLGDARAVEPLKVLLSSISPTVEYEEFGNYGESWTRTEDNPEYSAIETALQKLRANQRGASSSPVVSHDLDRSIIQKILKDRGIDLADIKDERLKQFLQFLKQNNLTDIVVMGGAIKSVLFNEEVADIDISVKMALTEEERTLFAPLTAAGNERVYQRAAESIGQLAEMLGVKAADFLPPSRGARKAFEGLDIDYFGPIKTERGVVIKRSIFDAATKQGYFTNTAAGLLRFGIDAEGNIYGDVGVLRELLQGNLTIEGDGSNFGINSILRVLRLKYQYGLRISDQDYQLMRNDLTRRRKHPLPPVVLEVARDQVKKLLTNTQDSEAAQQELETLGISALVSQSSSPITGEKLNQVKEILSMFGINEIENANELDGGVGSQDKPIHVFSPQGEMVLRRFQYEEPQLKFIVSVMNRLKSEGIPVPTLYYREGGDVLQSESYIADYQGSRYTLEEYLTTGKNVPLEDVSRDQFIEIAQLAAKINNALSGFQPQGNKRFKSRTEIAGDLQNSFAEYKKIVESLPVDKRQEGHILFRRYSDFFMNQLEIFRQEYDADAQKTSITHSDLHPGNIKFDGMGKIVGLIDFDFTITDHRVIEFNNLIMGKDDVAQDLPYSRDKMLAMVSAYNRAVNDKLSDAEIKAIIEVIRLRFLEEIHSRFVKENSHIPANIFEHPDQLPFAHTSIDLFKQFAEDFSTDKKIQAFVDEVNESGTIPDLHVQSSSPAITAMEGGRKTMDDVGGIDMKTIDLDRQGVGVDIQFDPAELQELIDAGIDGFAPVIINITPLPSVLPLLGLDPAIKEKPLELSLSSD